MSGNDSDVTVISLGNNFGKAVVEGAGIKVELDSDGHVTVYQNGEAIYANNNNNGEVNAPADARPAIGDCYPDLDDTTVAEPEIGELVESKGVYAGISPDTSEAMYVTPQDASGTLKWETAMKYAADLDANGHKDWRLPTKDELNILFENRAAIGGFNEGGSDAAGRGCWYWSSTGDDDSGHPNIACMQLFSEGHQGGYFKYRDASVRPVRSEPRP